MQVKGVSCIRTRRLIRLISREKEERHRAGRASRGDLFEEIQDCAAYSAQPRISGTSGPAATREEETSSPGEKQPLVPIHFTALLQRAPV
ncbi:hypothetical protein J2S90_000156 [Arthrobacter bambusae]|uniref:Uncharacterized protein n=1 Tax=Arthrobacter bambusae TaxID=1338426 RepID=A0AAW8DBA8_9MICC|nr:hypothetical protein [Arthrobacter bambusae]MDQ0128790.1 hypothetical protein [Arthrobacter bambusae]MDQ0180131.1 hypothetical protein [Arthrobacter bambusae]